MKKIVLLSVAALLSATAAPLFAQEATDPASAGMESSDHGQKDHGKKDSKKKGDHKKKGEHKKKKAAH